MRLITWVGIGDNLDLTAIPTNETSVFQNQPLANSFKTTLDLRLSSTICTGRKIKSKFKHLNFLQRMVNSWKHLPCRHKTSFQRRATSYDVFSTLKRRRVSMGLLRKFDEMVWSDMFTQPTFTCSRWIIKVPGKCVKSAQS